ncbi:MAG: magnesium transporter [Elusimicrobiota bacterium]
MKNTSDQILHIKNIIKEMKMNELPPMMESFPAVDIVDLWKEFSSDERLILFKILDFEKKLEVFERLPFKQQKEVIDYVTSKRLAPILNEMASDERADLFEHLPEEEVEKLFSLMKEKEVEDVKDLMEYGKTTAGGVMATEFVALKPEMTAKEALIKLQESVKSKEVRNIYALYHVDEEGRVIGGLSLQRLISARPDDRIADIAGDVEKYMVNANMDQEEVARIFTHYDLLSAPVIDDGNHLLGIITIDDIVDVIHQEATEDMAKMAGTESEELLSKSVFKIFRIRWPWLFASWLGGLVTMTIIGAFESTLMSAVAIASFMPVIMGMGGNVGVQSSTIVVRGLALGKVDYKKIGYTVFKQMQVGLILGLSYGILLGIVARFKYASEANMGMIGFVAGAGICLSMTIAATLGAFLPILFKKLNIDPAVATGPMVTTATDVISLSVYFLLATAVLV